MSEMNFNETQKHQEISLPNPEKSRKEIGRTLLDIGNAAAQAIPGVPGMVVKTFTSTAENVMDIHEAIKAEKKAEQQKAFDIAENVLGGIAQVEGINNGNHG
mgnify:CR=1 FL=1